MVGMRSMLAMTFVTGMCSDCHPKPNAAQVPQDAAPPPAASATPERPSIAPLRFVGNSMPSGGKRVEVADKRFASDAKVVLDPTFFLQLAIGEPPSRYNITTIAAGGRARHVYLDEKGGQREVQFSTTQPELERLVALLNENRFLQLPTAYHAPVWDGVSWTLAVCTEGRLKLVRVSNEFPESVVRVARYVTKDLIDARPELAARSVVVPFSNAESFLWSSSQHYDGCIQPGPGRTIDDDLCLPSMLYVYFTQTGPPKGSKVELTLQEGDKRIAHSVTAAGDDVRLEYDFRRIALDRRYTLTVRVEQAGKTLFEKTRLPVLTFGERSSLALDY